MADADTRFNGYLNFDGNNDKSPFQARDNVIMGNNVQFHPSESGGIYTTQPLDCHNTLNETTYQIYPGSYKVQQFPSSPAYTQNVRVVNTTTTPAFATNAHASSVTPPRIITGSPSRIIVDESPIRVVGGTPTRIILNSPTRSNVQYSNVTKTSAPNVIYTESQFPTASNLPNLQSNEFNHVPKPETVYLPPQRFIYDAKTGNYIPYPTNDPQISHILPAIHTVGGVRSGPATQAYAPSSPINMPYASSPVGQPSMPNYTPSSPVNMTAAPGTHFRTTLGPSAGNPGYTFSFGQNLPQTAGNDFKHKEAPTMFTTTQIQVQTKDVFGFKFERLDKVPTTTHRANELYYSIVVYFGNNSGDTTYKTSKHPGYTVENDLLNCNFQSELVKVPATNQEFIQMKVLEHLGPYETVVGYIKLKVSSLCSGHLLRVPIMGDDGLHKGSVVFEYALLKVPLTEFDGITRYSVNYDQKLANSRFLHSDASRKFKGFGPFPLLFGNFIKWCCDVRDQ